MKVGYNGSVLGADEAVISVYDHGFLYGIGLFETFRTYNGGKPYLLERHLQRLREGCSSVGIRYIPDRDELESWLRRLLEANGLEDAYVRLTVSAGIGELGLTTSDYERPNVFLLVKALPPEKGEVDREGKELKLLSTRRNSPEGEIRLKSLHYMNNIIAKRELAASGAAAGAEGLMMTREGWLAEGIVSNLFFARDGQIFTPDIGTGILPGITRKRVIELGEQLGYKIHTGYYTWEQLQQAEEIWLTNSVQEIVSVTKLTDERGNAVPVDGDITVTGSISRRLLQAYREDVKLVTAR
ncbi:aminodeoxychorismate lyase [Paenibacillus tarimensis]